MDAFAATGVATLAATVVALLIIIGATALSLFLDSRRRRKYARDVAAFQERVQEEHEDKPCDHNYVRDLTVSTTSDPHLEQVVCTECGVVNVRRVAR